MKPTVVLRYFDCRGRAQVFRYLLHDRNIAFIDERIPFDDNWQAWSRLKPDIEKSGPFNRLPVLHWNGETVVETWVIAQYLHQKLDGHRYDEKRNMAVFTLMSSLLEDIAMAYHLLNLDLAFPGADDAEIAGRIIPSVLGNLEIYQKMLNQSRHLCFNGSSPTIADYYLFEAIDTCRIVFQPVRDRLFDELPGLSRFRNEFADRVGMKTALSETPVALTARPDYRKRLAELHLNIQKRDQGG